MNLFMDICIFHCGIFPSLSESVFLLTVKFRFANSLALNDPLQTLYQLMSGRQPAAVTVSCRKFLCEGLYLTQGLSKFIN